MQSISKCSQYYPSLAPWDPLQYFWVPLPWLLCAFAVMVTPATLQQPALGQLEGVKSDWELTPPLVTLSQWLIGAGRRTCCSFASRQDKFRGRICTAELPYRTRLRLGLPLIWNFWDFTLWNLTFICLLPHPRSASPTPLLISPGEFP